MTMTRDPKANFVALTMDDRVFLFFQGRFLSGNARYSRLISSHSSTYLPRKETREREREFVSLDKKIATLGILNDIATKCFEGIRTSFISHSPVHRLFELFEKERQRT